MLQFCCKMCDLCESLTTIGPCRSGTVCSKLPQTATTWQKKNFLMLRKGYYILQSQTQLVAKFFYAKCTKANMCFLCDVLFVFNIERALLISLYSLLVFYLICYRVSHSNGC